MRIGSWDISIRKAQPEVLTEQRRTRPDSVAQTVGYVDDQMAATIRNLYKPGRINYELFGMLREIPMIARALVLYVRLIGMFKPVASSERAQKYIEDYIEEAMANEVQTGLRHWLHQKLDSYYTYGYGWSEGVPKIDFSGFDRLQNLDSRTLRFKRNNGVLEFVQETEKEKKIIDIKNQAFIYYVARMPRDGNVFGTSLLETLPRIAEILIRVVNSIGEMHWRAGAAPQLIQLTTMPHMPDDVTDETLDEAKGYIDKAFQELYQAKMRGLMKDVITRPPVGTKIDKDELGSMSKVFGDSKSGDLVVDLMCSGLGFPHFMLNMTTQATSWKLTTNQSDIITRNINNSRDDFSPTIKTHLNQELIMAGMPGEKIIKIGWDRVNLLDAVEQADAALKESQADQTRWNTLMSMNERGVISDDEMKDAVVRENLITLNLIKTISGDGLVGMLRLNAKYDEINFIMRDILEGALNGN